MDKEEKQKNIQLDIFKTNQAIDETLEKLETIEKDFNEVEKLSNEIKEIQFNIAPRKSEFALPENFDRTKYPAIDETSLRLKEMQRKLIQLRDYSQEIADIQFKITPREGENATERFTRRYHPEIVKKEVQDMRDFHLFWTSTLPKIDFFLIADTILIIILFIIILMK